jgi:hypothetical protein
MIQGGPLAGRRRFAVLAAAVALLLLLPGSALAVRAITRAVTDNVWFNGESQPFLPSYWASRTAASGARTVLIEVDWTSIAPNQPTVGDASNPADPQYHFAGYLDPLVQTLSNAGLQVAFLVTDAPRWAEANGGPSLFEETGAWKPNAAAFGQFAHAIAARYSGSYDGLPRVRYFQAWGEANFDIHLAPQYVKSGSSWVPYAPAMYRTMLNDFYNGIKAGDPSAQVITTGFGPYGDSPGDCKSGYVGNGCRMHPAEFARDLLCLSSHLSPVACSDPAHFDIMAADPYEISSPTTHAANPDDISAPDLGRLTKPLKKAVSTGRALPHAGKQLWVTEFSYDSRPPNPYGLSLAEQAKWLEESYYVFWEQGVSTAVWYLLRDESAHYNDNLYYSGIYFYNGKPKPSLTAMEFPFVVMQWGKKVNAWGIAPVGGAVTVQHKKGRRWVTLFKSHASGGGVFVRSVSKKLKGSFRAKVGSRTSLIWKR